jgi:tetratricopeptide (TPR) repeat protein
MRRLKRVTRILAAAAAVAIASALPAQERSQGRDLQPRTASALTQVRTQFERSDYAGALTTVRNLRAGVPPDSYDAYLLSQIEVQLLISLNRLTEAIQPLETALRLGESNPQFTEPQTELEHLNLLAQLHYQRAVSLPADAQKAGYETALNYFRRWMARTPRLTSENHLFAASLLYQLGTLNPESIDRSRIREALAASREAMLTAVNPSAQVYTLLVACQLALGEYADAAETLELMAERDPTSSTHWTQLLALYLAGSENPDPKIARARSLRALSTIERARSHGQLTGPRENQTRIALLFNLRDYSGAASALEAALADDSIENNRRNWELLSSAYQQLHRIDKAADALARASARFPNDGAIDLLRAQLLYGNGDIAGAYASASSAIEKGVERTGQTKLYLAYLAFELQRFSEARTWAEAARATGEVPADSINPLSSAIEDAVRARG